MMLELKSIVRGVDFLEEKNKFLQNINNTKISIDSTRIKELKKKYDLISDVNNFLNNDYDFYLAALFLNCYRILESQQNEFIQTFISCYQNIDNLSNIMESYPKVMLKNSTKKILWKTMNYNRFEVFFLIENTIKLISDDIKGEVSDDYKQYIP
ncbi:MAG: hypothetical protein Q8P20_08765 [bacterium]|nr:hypothetical protein [bacterium]